MLQTLGNKVSVMHGSTPNWTSHMKHATTFLAMLSNWWGMTWCELVSTIWSQAQKQEQGHDEQVLEENVSPSLLKVQAPPEDSARSIKCVSVKRGRIFFKKCV
eukprot:m.126276 g.126276  ORF g.126276 m.126276 type:complete len:103 (-) comp15637_c0_seq5:1366-1674(-)